ncbi:MAG: hypothetical protein DRI90_00475 [Deltaproteobacteria bacterium]|nr:MAG: hypothetical protein DRI90_00475 [Deltaproteobacteria bacterium]
MQPPRATQLEHTKRLLAGRLDAVQERLARSGGVGDAADELSAERLVLTVALMLIEQDIAEAQRGERVKSLTVEQRLAQAREAIGRARQRLATGEVAVDHRFGWASILEDEDRYGYLSLGERERKKKTPKRSRNRGRRGCSPGDPLCVELDGWAGEDEGEGDAPWAVNPPPGEARPKPSPRHPTDGKQKDMGADDLAPPAPVPPDAPAAARVAHAKAPEGVGRAVAVHHGQLMACLSPSLRSQGLRLRVRVRLDAQGAFREPQVLAADIGPQVVGCIVDVFRQMRVPGYHRGSRVITVPLWLSREP